MRRKKKPIHLSIIQPMLVSVLLATSIPLVTLAATRTDADAGAESPIFEIYNPRADQTQLFDAVEFRKAHRARYSNPSGEATVSSSISSSQSSAAPCADTQEATSDVKPASTMLRYDDLSTTEKAELWKQLRIGGCPYDVLPGYRELCELMLRQRQRPAAVPKALRNPHQDTLNENR